MKVDIDYAAFVFFSYFVLCHSEKEVPPNIVMILADDMVSLLMKYNVN